MPAQILVVDDEPDLEVLIRQKFRKRIRQKELQFVFASNGVEALERLEAQPEINIVLTDINMPEMDGLTLLGKLAERSHPTLSTVVISAYGDLARIRMAMNRGAFDFLTKPIDLQDLEITVDRTLRHVQRLQDAVEQKRLAREAQAQLLKHEALQESERRLAQFLEAMPIGVFVASADGKPYYANQTALEILGRDLLAGEKTDKLSHFDRAYLAGTNQPYPQQEQPLSQALQGKNATADNLEIRGEQTIPIEVSARPIFDEGGKIIYAIAAFKDITRRKEAEAERVRFTQALRLKTQQLAEYNRTLEQKVSERTAQLAASKRKAEQSQAAAESANRAKSTFLANMSHELRTPLNAILGFTQLMNRTLETDPEHQEYLDIISRSGEHLLALINDVLAMSKIEAGRVTVRENRFDLHSLLASLEEMLELKAFAKGLQLIFERNADVPRYVQADESKLRQILINLLGNGIKFTQQGSVTLRVSEFRIQNSEFRIEGKGNSGATPRLRKTQGNAYQERQKAIGTREDDTLSPFPFPLPKAEGFSPLPISHTLKFEVEDTGPGIAVDELDILFEPFVQTETGRQSQSGTGLGLPISREFVRLMGGDIQVSSTIGCGTRLTFTIPIAVPKTQEIQVSQPLRQAIGIAPNCTRYRILVVEDKADNREVLLKLFAQLGFQVREAADGREAVEIWERWQPHLIWMDIRMPVMDGCKATRYIRRKEQQRWSNANIRGGQEELKRTAIIALTAIAFEEERSVVFAAGCDDIVLKPFQESILLEKMAEYLKLHLIYEERSATAEARRKGHLPAIVAKQRVQEALDCMSSGWIAQLHQAAVCADAEVILALIEDIPPEQSVLRNAIAFWVQNFDFENISKIAQK